MKNKLFFLILGFILVFSMLTSISAYSNGFCIWPYNTSQYSTLTKTECLNNNIQCPTDKPYVYHFNDYAGCACTSDPFGDANAQPNTYGNAAHPTSSSCEVDKKIVYAGSRSDFSSLCSGVNNNDYATFDLIGLNSNDIISATYILDYCGSLGGPSDGKTVSLYKDNNLISYKSSSDDGIKFDVTSYIKNAAPNIIRFDFQSMTNFETTMGGYLEIKTNIPITSCTLGKVVDCTKATVETPTQPNNPTPTGFAKWISEIINWIKNLFSTLFIQQTIIGANQTEPNTQQTYNIDILTTIPDSDWNDGSYQVQYANWALTDKDGNVKQQGEWETVNGKYNKNITITTPSNIGDYILLSMITQYDMNYNYTSKLWITDEEKIMVKEAINLKNKYTVTSPTNPTPSGWQNFLNAIVDFFKKLFGIK